jgi:ubiquinone/menaquinone biosynthesis C-methylase UbiE
MTRWLYEDSRIRAVTGTTLRPGGFVLTDRAIAACNLSEGAKILDLGCGLGATVKYLIEKYHFKTFGAERSASFLTEAKAHHPNLPIFQATAQALPCRNESLNAVICECVLSLTNPVQQTLKELYRVLMLKGWLIITDMYLRDIGIPCGKIEIQEDQTLSCLNGAVSQQETKRRIQEAGFEILLWEDHSRYLKELAAKLVFEEISLPGICTKPGYYLMIARKVLRGQGSGDYPEPLSSHPEPIRKETNDAE